MKWTVSRDKVSSQISFSPSLVYRFLIRHWFFIGVKDTNTKEVVDMTLTVAIKWPGSTVTILQQQSGTGSENRRPVSVS
jgi:hypothetical protein